MDSTERAQKKVREAGRLRNVPPERTLQMAFDLLRMTRALNEAATSVAIRVQRQR